MLVVLSNVVPQRWEEASSLSASIMGWSEGTSLLKTKAVAILVDVAASV